MKSIGKKIKELRERKGYSQHKLAKLTNIKQVNISRYERNAVNIPADKLKKIADSLGESTEYFLNKKTVEKNILTSEQKEFIKLIDNLDGNDIQSVKDFIKYVRTKRKNKKDEIKF